MFCRDVNVSEPDVPASQEVKWGGILLRDHSNKNAWIAKRPGFCLVLSRIQGTKSRKGKNVSCTENLKCPQIYFLISTKSCWHCLYKSTKYDFALWKCTIQLCVFLRRHNHLDQEDLAAAGRAATSPCGRRHLLPLVRARGAQVHVPAWHQDNLRLAVIADTAWRPLDLLQNW